jgi:hypothetical protein
MKPPILPTFHVATLCITHATNTRESGSSGCRILQDGRQSFLFASKLHTVYRFGRTFRLEYQPLSPSCWRYVLNVPIISAFFLDLLGDEKAGRLPWSEQTIPHIRALDLRGAGQGFAFPLGPLLHFDHIAGNMCLSETQDQPRSLPQIFRQTPRDIWRVEA